MAKRTVEIDDTLQDCVDEAIESVKNELIEYLDQNQDTDEAPDLYDDLDYSGAIHQIIDGSVPIYTADINDIFYLHGDDVEAAFDDAGIGSKDDKGWPMGWKAAAIYCYIEQQVQKWYRVGGLEVFQEWQQKQAA